MKYVFIFLGALALISPGVIFFFASKREQVLTNAPTIANAPVPSSSLSPELIEILTQQLESVARLAQDPVIIQAAVASTEQNAGSIPEIIAARDSQWAQAPEEGELVKSYLTNPAAKKLLVFQENHPGFPELFIADGAGFNVALTNKTSDIYQADEAWWQQCLAQGAGRQYWGEVEYDESAQSEAIPLYAPVMNENTATGCIKAVLSITAIQRSI